MKIMVVRSSSCAAVDRERSLLLSVEVTLQLFHLMVMGDARCRPRNRDHSNFYPKIFFCARILILEGRPDLCNLWDLVAFFNPARYQNIICISVHPFADRSKHCDGVDSRISSLPSITLLRRPFQKPGILSFYSIGSKNEERGRYRQDKNNSFLTSSSFVHGIVMHASTLQQQTSKWQLKTNIVSLRERASRAKNAPLTALTMVHQLESFVRQGKFVGLID